MLCTFIPIESDNTPCKVFMWFCNSAMALPSGGCNALRDGKSNQPVSSYGTWSKSILFTASKMSVGIRSLTWNRSNLLSTGCIFN